jgi:type IV pilus assembly protein PilA
MHAHKSKQHGFTLIELMIVVAIITILVALAVPAYISMIVRNQVTDGMSLAARWEAAIASYYATVGNMPASEKALKGVPTTGSQYVAGIAVNNGQILITYGGRDANASIRGLILSLTPALDSNNDIKWICGAAPATLPNGTPLTAPQNTPPPVTDGKAIPMQYLPAECRAS